eukprot:TRINITY_DN55327_c0_g1_i1.p1 TRINITY_DN55327_c0_g1~~TRINITY_DN55327_c0_g1_i1.p1  ORF type:complete len:669 (+),score=263.62 TRINITY_DN55327_c0_g1_i1:93-2009(+)
MNSPTAKFALGAAGVYAAWKVADSKLNIMDDVEIMKTLGPVAKQVQGMAARKGFTVADLWDETRAIAPQKVCLIDADTDRRFTYEQCDRISNVVAQWASSKFKPGESVAVIMENRAEYFFIWLGLAKAGCPAALINNNIKGKPLVHSISVSAAVGAVFGTEVAENAADVAGDLRQAGVRCIASYGTGGSGGVAKPDFADESLDEVLASGALSDKPVDKQRRKDLSISSTFGFIYTSGTTGLPKACRISHLKLLNYGMVAGFYRVGQDDVVFGSGLPLYHTSGHLGLMHMVRTGAAFIVKRKFSATTHWEDCAKYGATAMQYIGELCRYLLNTPARPADKQHRVRVAYGNGLRPEIWDQFQRRFNIPEIGEFYGATEGNGGLFNHSVNYKGQGAVGRMGSLLRKLRPMYLVQFDVQEEKPVRGPDGFCKVCANNETGELIIPIRKVPTADGEQDDFEGYTDQKATEKKVLRDVFVKGDAYFRTGDLLRRDGQYYYFVDRIGDTFRWKGENVSTMEVSEVLSAYPGVVEANVYGVQVPGKDGRACAVALTLSKGTALEPDKFAAYARKHLPSYSVPLLVRFVPEVEITGTFKHKKGDYRNQGCNPTEVTDQLWWFNPARKTYEPYGPEQYQAIVQGKARL